MATTVSEWLPEKNGKQPCAVDMGCMNSKSCRSDYATLPAHSSTLRMTSAPTIFSYFAPIRPYWLLGNLEKYYVRANYFSPRGALGTNYQPPRDKLLAPY